MSANSFQSILSQKLAFFIFFFGKSIRFIMFFGFLYFLLSETGSLAGYTLNQTLFFYLTFNLVDVVAQFLYREVYRFRPLVVSGAFDLVLLRPMSALFRSLLGGIDFIDLATIPPLMYFVLKIGIELNPNLLDLLLFVLLVINGVVIATAFHIFVISMALITLEVDHSVMIYRDIVNLGKLPVDIYSEPIRSFLTFIIPVGIMVTLPAKALIGIVSIQSVALSLLFGVGIFAISLRMWKYSLKYYTSASS